MLIAFLLGYIAVCIPGSALGATDKLWDGSSSDWTNAIHWIPAGAPAEDDHVIITNGNVRLSTAITITGSLDFSGGSLSGTFTNAGILNWTGGDLNSTITIATNGVLNLLGDADKRLNQARLNNAGTVNWLGGRLLALANDYNQTVYLTNLAGAVWNILTDTNTTRASTWSGYPAPTFVLHNAGTLIKSPGTGTNALDGLNVVNTGLLDIQTGGLQFNGSLDNYGEIRVAANAAAGLNSPTTFRTSSTLNAAVGGMVNYQASYKLMTFEPGAMFSATTTNRITGYCQFAGTVNLPNFELAAGSLYGTFTNAGILNWTGGDLNSAITIATNGVLNLLGDADKRLNQARLNNAGTVNWLGGRLLALANDYNQTVYLTNLAGAVWNILTDTNTTRASTWSGYPAPTFVLHNDGTLIKSPGTGTNALDGLNVVNTGLLDIQTGGIQFNGSLDNYGEIRVAANTAVGLNSTTTFRTGGTLNAAVGGMVNYQASYKLMTFEPGAVFSPTTTNRITGYCQFAGTVNLPNFELAAGSLYGTFTNAGILNWTGGDLNGAITIATNGVLNLLGDADKRLNQARLNNAGTVNWLGGAAAGLGQRL